ncbi:hypothetical protein COT82_00745 [Candidatus Campbellbacteria bacterium CG10_big_fil_rev_8_21_14_0_10_35_52]|uniref:Small ribosomal subunit protein bS6 n=1 Tax=Candidatus Campbellbacteria bacterium CG10_big_fil_rev_8_21_14_0_10_35_52 TaxID=1974527 RepID=A0A2M6WVP5_9BACT|nr:MAG: hypothetical protein COT82_00745 [Candidatus Campbellbacteria bacterium CG10_big_fil_rev_8_21_14_0_10_35_52]
MIDEVTKEDIASVSEITIENDFETQVYELGFHIIPSVEENNIAGEINSIKSAIEKLGGIFVAEGFPKLITLAYTMTKDIDGKRYKFDNAYFGWIKFEIGKDNIIKVQELIDSNNNILRFLIIKTVRESTLAPKDAVFSKEGVKKFKYNTDGSKIFKKDAQEKKDKPKKKEVKMSEEELDKTIEELIAE